MRRFFIILVALTVLLLTSVGGLLDARYLAPAVRREQTLIDRENLRQMHDEWRRGGWLQDQPTEETPYRIHGGVGPASSNIE